MTEILIDLITMILGWIVITTALAFWESGIEIYKMIKKEKKNV